MTFIPSQDLSVFGTTNIGGSSMRPQTTFVPRLMVLVWALFVLCFGGVAAPKDQEGAAKSKNNACHKTSNAMHESCLSGAMSDLSLALAKCVNIPDPSEQKACTKQAKADFNADLETCKAGFEVRKEICEALGGGAYDPVIDPQDFSTTIDNPYFPLKPGTTFIYEGVKAGTTERIEVVVTAETETILGVKCVVVQDTATVDGEVVEDTTDWYAQDNEGNVWYFGELAKQYEGGQLVSLEGSWKAGVDGAKPGIIMEGADTVKVHDLYRQEFALGVAEDMAEVLSLNSTAEANKVVYTGCLETKDFSPLAPDVVENKFFAPGVGQVLTIDVETGEREELLDIIKKP